MKKKCYEKKVLLDFFMYISSFGLFFFLFLNRNIGLSWEKFAKKHIFEKILAKKHVE